MGLMDDAKRAAERSADLAEMSDAMRIDRLRAELANARLERDNIAALNSSLIAELAEAKARIAEVMDRLCYTADECDLITACEHWVANFHETEARAERAEAERDDMREALDNSQSLLVALLVEPRIPSEIEKQIIENRAALAPSPAGRK